jgi:hypothetical protein
MCYCRIASLVTHMLSTAWTGFQISHTSNFRADFNRLTTNGTCGENLLASYWKARSEAEIPSLVLNIVALLISAFLSWRIIKVPSVTQSLMLGADIMFLLSSSLDGKLLSGWARASRSSEFTCWCWFFPLTFNLPSSSLSLLLAFGLTSCVTARLDNWLITQPYIVLSSSLLALCVPTHPFSLEPHSNETCTAAPCAMVNACGHFHIKFLRDQLSNLTSSQ